jgi:hypothetical protein
MKIAFIYVILFILSLGFIIATDLLSGWSLDESLTVIRESFSGTTFAESFFALIALLSPFLSPIAKLWKNKRNASTKTGASGTS